MKKTFVLLAGALMLAAACTKDKEKVTPELQTFALETGTYKFWDTIVISENNKIHNSVGTCTITPINGYPNIFTLSYLPHISNNFPISSGRVSVENIPDQTMNGSQKFENMIIKRTSPTRFEFSFYYITDEYDYQHIGAAVKQ